MSEATSFASARSKNASILSPALHGQLNFLGVLCRSKQLDVNGDVIVRVGLCQVIIHQVLNAGHFTVFRDVIERHAVDRNGGRL